MPEILSQSIQWQNNTDQSSTAATLKIIKRTHQERLKLALIRLAIFWGLAIVSVPIVIAHYVLVPGFLIAGPVVAIRTYRTQQVYEQADGVCPQCSETISIDLESKPHAPSWLYCPKCEKGLRIIETLP